MACQFFSILFSSPEDWRRPLPPGRGFRGSKETHGSPRGPFSAIGQGWGLRRSYSCGWRRIPCLRPNFAFTLLAGSENDATVLLAAIATGAERFSGKEVL